MSARNFLLRSDLCPTAAHRQPELDYDIGGYTLQGTANREGLGRRYPKLAALARARKG